MAPAMKIVLGLLTFVTVGMIIGALFQLAFIRRLEDSYGNYHFPTTKLHTRQSDGNLRLPIGLSHWRGDQEAEILRLGYECDYLKAIALPRLQVSTVVDAKTGMGIKSKVRTSSGMFLRPNERKYPMIQAIEKRISVFSQIPAEHGEQIQVLRYEKDQFYKPHHDYFSDPFNIKRSQRIATMLMYLSDDVEGGETYFPRAGTGDCSCGGKVVKGMSIKPIKGDAVLFWSMGLDGQSDPNSLHGGCAVCQVRNGQQQNG
ncbi:prolyl 4-hydroxylase 1 isoform X2 [Gossypium hirsutum]|uniref:Prolyl 4-hydroxylase 1 isoform X2 n=1 Tax=Gossypium hirsutum TaxID=3635 RepID=A0ABM2ZPB0_GOSHI|nr:prolyl 4-hydroxylase 1 isoform X2 [Gossypium hirsutum]